jgi:hypothetical protein
VRESPAAYVMRDLIDERALLSVYDPQVERKEMFVEFDYTVALTEKTLPGLEGMITTAGSAYEAAAGSHAIAILTEWDEFTTLDYKKVGVAMCWCCLTSIVMLDPFLLTPSTTYSLLLPLFLYVCTHHYPRTHLISSPSLSLPLSLLSSFTHYYSHTISHHLTTTPSLPLPLSSTSARIIILTSSYTISRHLPLCLCLRTDLRVDGQARLHLRRPQRAGPHRAPRDRLRGLRHGQARRACALLRQVPTASGR